MLVSSPNYSPVWGTAPLIHVMPPQLHRGRPFPREGVSPQRGQGAVQGGGRLLPLLKDMPTSALLTPCGWGRLSRKGRPCGPESLRCGYIPRDRALLALCAQKTEISPRPPCPRWGGRLRTEPCGPAPQAGPGRPPGDAHLSGKRNTHPDRDQPLPLPGPLALYRQEGPSRKVTGGRG